MVDTKTHSLPLLPKRCFNFQPKKNKTKQKIDYITIAHIFPSEAQNQLPKEELIVDD